MGVAGAAYATIISQGVSAILCLIYTYKRFTILRLKKEDFKISLEQNLLTVSAERKEESTESDAAKKYNRIEYNYSSFMRTFTLPETADHAKISAEYKDGILFISVAKKEEAKILSREIAIS